MERKIMRIGLAFNLRKSFSERNSVFDSPETIENIKKALESKGHRVKLYEAGSETLFYLLSLDRPQIVFNVSEGKNGIYGEAYVPSILDELKIPYTGSSALATSLAVNKVATKMIMQSAGVNVPKLFQFITRSDEEIREIDLFPVIVKPVFEGASIGISSKSICNSIEEVKISARRIFQRLKRPIMIEEFIDGVEITAGVIGNFPPRMLPPMEIDFSPLSKRETKAAKGIQTYKFKTDYSEKAQYFLPARVTDETIDRIEENVLKAFRVLNIRDLARFDLRIDKNGVPFILEINAVVGLEKDRSDFPRMYKIIGKSYEDLINDILNFALERITKNERVLF
jgi:D-alanine-D-alanine ligase